MRSPRLRRGARAPGRGAGWGAGAARAPPAPPRRGRPELLQPHDLLLLNQRPAVVVLLIRILHLLNGRKHPDVGCDLRPADRPKGLLHIRHAGLKKKRFLLLGDIEYFPLDLKSPGGKLVGTVLLQPDDLRPDPTILGRQRYEFRLVRGRGLGGELSPLEKHLLFLKA